MGASFSEPTPRCSHFSAVVEEKLCIFGGRTRGFKSAIATCVHSFDPFQESWSEDKCSGVPPPGLYYGACASAAHHVYVYGGHDGSAYQSSLHQLDTRTWTWKQLSGTGPMRKGGCGMVAYDSRLALFGGFGPSSSPTQPGAEYIKEGDGNNGWTNELQIFDLKEGEK